MPAAGRWHTTEYLEYLRSPEWEATRELAFAVHGRRCQECGASWGLEVHHLHYETLGNESPYDLRILCHRCHARADRLRRRGRHARGKETT